MRALALLLLGLLAVARADVVIRSEVRASELLAGSRAGLQPAQCFELTEQTAQ